MQKYYNYYDKATPNRSIKNLAKKNLSIKSRKYKTYGKIPP